MDFSNTTTKLGLIQTCESLCLLGDGGISSNATLLKQFTGFLNLALGEVWHHIAQVNKSAKQDDLNYTDIPNATITLVANQQDYTLPVASTGANANTLHRVNGVYYVVNSERVYLRPMDNDEALSGTAGIPTAYRIQGKSLFFDVPVSTDFTTTYTSFHVEFQRIPSYFASTDTTKQAGFMAIHHPLLALKASAWYLLPTNPSLSKQYSSGREDIPADFESGITRLKKDYAQLDDSFDNRVTFTSAGSGR